MTVRRLPWGVCHIRGQDLLALGVNRDTLIVDSASRLQLQRVTPLQAKGGHGGSSGDVAALGWCDHRGALALLWESGLLCVLENPSGLKEWDAVDWTITAEAVQPEAQATVCWSAHSLLVAVAATVTVYAFADDVERKKHMPSPPALRHQQSVSLPFPHLATSLCPNGAYIATSYIDQPVVHVWCGKGRAQYQEVSPLEGDDNNDSATNDSSGHSNNSTAENPKRPTSARQRRHINTPLATLPHTAPAHVVEWRGGLPGVLPMLMTACGADDHVHIWAEGKTSTPMDHADGNHVVSPTGFTTHEDRHPPPPTTHIVTREQSADSEPPVPVDTQAFGLWVSIGPFAAAGAGVTWLKWANFGSTKASQHLASRVRHHGFDHTSGGSKLLKTIAGTWILGLESDGTLRLWCILNQHNPPPGEPRLPDQPEVVEVSAPASWKAWKASSFGAFLNHGDVGSLRKDVVSSAEARVRGPQIAATGFFDPRGVGVPAEIALVFKPDFLRDSRKLLLTTLGTSLARDGDLRLHCICGSAVDSRLLAFEEGPGPSSIAMHPQHLHSSLRSPHTHSDDNPHPQSSASALTSPTAAPMCIHPTLPFIATKAALGTVIRTAFLPHTSYPLYTSPSPISLPIPLNPIRLPEGRTAEFLLWVHDASGLEKSPPCLLVLDSDKTLFLYQAQRHETTLPEPDASATPRHRGATFASTASGGFECAVGKSTRTLSSASQALGLTGVSMSQGSGGMGVMFYEVNLRPDPVYGLGMRLEKREGDILVASFKRHPHTDGLLPAEASGFISVGDALVGANGYSLAGMELEQAVGVMRTVGVSNTGEVSLRFRRLTTPFNTMGDGSRTRRVPSIYGIDFIGASGRGERLDQTMSVGEDETEQPLASGQILKWNLCGRGLLSGERWDAATLLPLDNHNYDFTMPTASSAHASTAAVPSGGDAPREGKRGPEKQWIRVAVLVGCAGRRLGAYDVMVNNGALRAVEMVSWEGEWAVGSLVFLSAYQALGHGFIVIGIDGGGVVWRWSVLRDHSLDATPKSTTDIAPLPNGPTSTINPSSNDPTAQKKASSSAAAAAAAADGRTSERCVYRVGGGKVQGLSRLQHSEAFSAAPGDYLATIHNDLNGVSVYSTDPLGIAASLHTPPQGPFVHSLMAGKHLRDIHLCASHGDRSRLVLGLSHGTRSQLFEPTVGKPATSWPLLAESPALPGPLPCAQLRHVPSLLLHPRPPPLHDAHPHLVIGLQVLSRVLPAVGSVVKVAQATLAHVLGIIESVFDPQGMLPRQHELVPGLWDVGDDRTASLGKQRIRSAAEKIRDMTSQDNGGGKLSGLPHPLSDLSPADALALWALLDALGTSAPASPKPSFSDQPLGSAALLAFDIRRSLVALRPPTAAAVAVKFDFMSSNDGGEGGGLGVGGGHTDTQAAKQTSYHRVCASAVPAALFADESEALVDYLFPKGDSKLEWDAVRNLYVPLWCRSLAPLKRLAEELAVATFRRTQSPIHCAMLYMAAGKKSTLRALARTSKDPRKSLDKLMQHDLASQRGKLVMEKNAFHLLRNRNYEAAAAVFLLPEPPLLDMALDVIVRHLDDPMLALFVCRLIEGGMYPSAGEDDAIGPLAYELIERDVVPWARAEGGGPLEAAAHMWIGKMESVIEALFRGDEGKKTHETALTYEQALARTNGIMDSVLSPMVAAEVDPSMALSWRAVAKAVAAAGQVEGLELLTLELLDDLTECTGAEHETAMAVMAGRPLPARDDGDRRASRHGGASTRAFDSVFGRGDEEHGVHVSLGRAGSGGRMNGGLASSSIFDQFDVQPPSASATFTANTQPSSIFDAYDVPSKAHTTQQQQPTSNDIFSAWDVPQPPPPSSHRASFDSTGATSPQSQTLRPSSSMSLRRDRTQSSRRPSAKTPTSTDTGLGTGDIFAQFDAPQPQPPRDPEPDDGLMGRSGSMFDQHDNTHGSISTLRRKGSVLQGRLTSTVQMATDSGLGAGDIFAQFDAPPPTPSQQQHDQQASSSIFDQYDVPKVGGGGGGGGASTTYTPDTGLGTGGVFDQYDPAPTPGWGAGQMQQGSMAEPVDDGEIEVCYVTTTVEYDDETLMEFQKGPLRDLSLWCIDTRIMVAASRLVRETEALLWTWQAYNPLVQSDPLLASVFPLDPDPPSLPLTDHCAGIAKSLSTQHNLPHHALLSAALRRCPALAISAAAREDEMAPPRYPLALRALFLQMLDRHATLDMLIRSAARRILVQCCTLARPLTATEPPTDLPPLCPSLTRSLVSVAWDLETCTSLHIMGAVQLSPWTLAEAAVGARMALVLTSWRQNYPALQILATHPPHTNLVSGVPSCTALEEEEQALLPPVGVVLDQARSHSCDVTDVTGTESDAEVDPLSQLAAAVTAIASSGSGNEADGSSSGGGARGSSLQHPDVDGAAAPGTERHRRNSSSWKPSMNDIQRLKSLAFDRVRSLPEMAKAGRATSSSNHHTSSSGPTSHHTRAHHHHHDDSGDPQQQRRHGASEGELEKLDSKKDQGQTVGQRIYEHTAGMGGGHPSSADQHRPGFTVQEGWEQYQECTRTEAEAELASKSPGSFILRPKGNNLDVVLTVRTSDQQSSGVGGGGIRVGGNSQPQAQMYGSSSSNSSHNSHCIRHFVIRVIPPSTSGAPPAFRCGSLGPYPDLEELLFEISSCLDVGLRLHWSRRRTMGDDVSMSASEGYGDGRSSEWPWQQTYLSLSPNGTLFRSLAQHAHLTLTSLDDSGASPITPTDPSVPCPLRHVIDLLALRAVLRQCCDLLRSKQPTSASIRPATSSSTGSFACALDADDPSDELCSFFRVVFEPEAIFMGPLARPRQAPAINSEGLAGSASSGLLAPLTRWVDVLERQLQAWLAPRIAFRPPREERERFSGMLKAASEPAAAKSYPGYGDRVLRIMMRKDCDVPFHNLRVGMGPRTAQVVCFQAADAAGWMVKHGYEPDVASAKQALSECEAKRVIQRVRGAGDDDRYGVYYRYIDPWQVDPHLDGPVGVLSEGIVGRMAVEPIRAGEAVHIPELERLGPSVQALWSSLRGDAWVKETVALAVPPLEREAGPTCRPDSSVDAFNTDMTEAYTRAITRHLYRNVLFSRVQLPYRFMALIQADLTDLRQVVPVGTAQHPRHMDVYAIMKLKRKAAPLPGSGIAMPAPVTARNRTIDTVITDNVRAILHTNAHGSSAEDKEPSLTTALNATFRFALPDECAPSRGLEAAEWLSKGPPRVMHIFVYEKRTIMADTLLGDVEVALAQLTEEDFLDQWIPLRNPSGHRQSVTWLVRVQVLLSFLLMRVRDVDGATNDAEASALADDMMRPSADLGYDDEVRVSMMLDDIG